MVSSLGNEVKVIEEQRNNELHLLGNKFRQVYVNFLNFITKVDFK